LTGCTGIEFTDGTLEDAADGTISMSGTSVSNDQCIGPCAYEFTVSPDGLTLFGSDTLCDDVPMTLTRMPDENCFQGHWVSGSLDYFAQIAAAPFLAPEPAAGITGVASLGALSLISAWRMRSRDAGRAPRLRATACGSRREAA
jgi:hypothetical protein